MIFRKELTIIEANRVDRVFDIHPETLVVIEHVAVTGGSPTSGRPKAAGINVGYDGKLTLNYTIVGKNEMQAGIGTAPE